MAESGVSRGTRSSLRPSLRETSAHRVIRLCEKPDAMAEEIMRKSLKYNGGKPSDDMTVLVLGLFDTYDK